jgi:hypothetical protein
MTFDSLDLDQEPERRTAVYVLEEFYGIVMYRIGVEKLNLHAELKSKNLSTQWNRIINRLEALDGFDFPDEYNGIIQKLKSFRNNVAHDYTYDPPKEHLAELRRDAVRWRAWLIEQSERYDEIHRELNARETLLKLSDESINFVEDARIPDREPFSQDVKSAKGDIEDLRDDLDQIKTETSEITPELVRLFSEAKNLENFVSTSLEGEAAVDIHIETEVDRIMEEKAFRRQMEDS